MSNHVQVRFYTKQNRYSVPNYPFSVPSSVEITDLGALINSLLAENDIGWSSVEFDFLIRDEFLRIPLEKHLEYQGISTESVIDVEYVEKHVAPSPEDSINHDDWVSAVHASEDWFLTACYDSTIHIWRKDGAKILTIPGHLAPVKAIRWMKHDGPVSSFISASHDQTAMIWSWNSELNSVECMSVCQGHQRSVESIAVNEDQTMMATGSFDKMVHIWSTLPGELGAINEECRHPNKKLKTEHGASTLSKAPVATLCGHTEAVSSVLWTDKDELITSSWDHTIRIWDVELGGIKDKMVGSKNFFDLSYSPLNRLLISASADPHIRVWDPRAMGGSVMKWAYTSHTAWVNCLQWSTTLEHQFISGSQDSKLKQWDVRSPKAPLYDISGHNLQILCCDWSNPEYILSGGADNELKIFRC